MGLKFKEESRKGCSLSLGFYNVEIWTLRKLDQNYLEGFEMWCWSIMEMISWTDCVRNETETPKG